MTKLYYRYGTMNSTKTLQLLAVAHSYREQGKTPVLIKPSTDTRKDTIWTRAGIEQKADIIITPHDDNIDLMMSKPMLDKADVVLIDEVNFLTVNQIKSLIRIVDLYRLPVIAYGLKTDFQGVLFPASKMLLEWADKVEEIKTVCHNGKCKNKAMFNMRVEDGKPVVTGNQVVVGDLTGEIKYLPVCRKCYVNSLQTGRVNRYKC